ncbi:hypothetical protein ACFCXR_21925 [Streptomyces noursei]|uniref:hypothetical protein n=1 Tax=Streptomyces TaxID=1883 RepID=UPI0035DBB3B5
MPTTPATRAEVDAWITVLRDHGHLHSAEPGPEGAWTVQRTAISQPRTFHYSALALDYVAEGEVRRNAPELPR